MLLFSLSLCVSVSLSPSLSLSFSLFLKVNESHATGNDEKLIVDCMFFGFWVLVSLYCHNCVMYEKVHITVCLLLGMRFILYRSYFGLFWFLFFFFFETKQNKKQQNKKQVTRTYLTCLCLFILVHTCWYLLVLVVLYSLLGCK
jgi:hypothetical protein